MLHPYTNVGEYFFRILKLRGLNHPILVLLILNPPSLSQNSFPVPPDIADVDTSSDVIVNEGYDATLICRANGHPKPQGS